MHNNHMNPALIRARIRRTIDPCLIHSARLLREDAELDRIEVYRYSRRSLASGIAMALSGTLSGEDSGHYALIMGELPRDVYPAAGDMLAIGDEKFRVAGVTPWPSAGASALIRLTLQPVEP